MTQLNLALACAAATVLVIGLFSQAIKKAPLQEATLAVLVGAAAGPFVFDLIDLAGWGNPVRIMEEASRLTLAIALMGVALRLTRADLRRLWRPGSVLVLAGMLGMWLVASVLAWWILGAPFWLAALIGAAITPTDPVIASAIVTGPFAHRYLPERIRATLSLESGANDGLAYLLVILPILFLTSPGDAWTRWMVEGLVVGVLVAIAIGIAIGVAAARLLHWVRQRQLMESYSFLSFTVALSLFTLAATALLGADALISVFVAGLAFDLCADTGEKRQEEEVQETISKLFTLPLFVLFGATLPWEAWSSLGWPIAVFALAILVFRRIPVLMLLAPLLRPTLGPRDTAYLGWFGPIGVAAIYYAAMAERHTGETLVWHVASATVLASVIAHGVSAAPLSRFYARGLTGGA